MMAACTAAVQFELVRLDGEPVLTGDLLLQALDVTVFKLDDLTATGTDQVIMMSFVCDVVVLCLRPKVSGLGEPGLAEKVQGTVDSRKTDMRILLCQQTVHLFRGDVLHFQKRAEDLLPLACQLQLMFGQMDLEGIDLFGSLIHERLAQASN
jgi:hypothetical protein